MPPSNIVSKRVLECWNNDLTNSQIAVQTGFTLKQIRSALQRKGLKCNRYPKLKLEGELQQLVLGSLLGDGQSNFKLVG